MQVRQKREKEISWWSSAGECQSLLPSYSVKQKQALRMTDRELDALVAENIFGWRWFECVSTACLVPPGMAESWDKAGEWMYKPLPDGPGKLFRDDVDGIRFYDSSQGGHTHPDIPHFSTDIAQAYWIHDKIKGPMIYKFKKSLARIVVDDTTGPMTGATEVWLMIKSSPKQRCLAALEAVGVKLEKAK